MSSLWSTLSHRRDVRALAAYAVVAFGTLQVADIVVKALELPPWVLKATVIVSLLGFPLTLAVVWAVTTPDAAQEPRRPHRRVFAGALAVALALLATAVVLRLWTQAPGTAGTERTRERRTLRGQLEGPSVRVGLPPALPGTEALPPAPPEPPRLGGEGGERIVVPPIDVGALGGPGLRRKATLSVIDGAIELAAAGRPDQALELFEKAGRGTLDDTYLSLHRAMLLRQAGRWPEAEAELRSAAAGKAGWPLPVAKYLTGQLDETAMLQEAIADGAAARSHLAEAHYLLGRFAETQREPDLPAAQRHFQAAMITGAADYEVGWSRRAFANVVKRQAREAMARASESQRRAAEAAAAAEAAKAWGGQGAQSERKRAP